MALHQLTDAACRNAACHTGTVRKLPDGGGLYLWVTPDGAKRWRYRYAIRGINRKGEPALIEKLVSLGTYPQVPLAEARTKAAEARRQADPGAERKAKAQADSTAKSNTFEAVARQWLGRQSQWTKKYSHDTLARLERYAFPLIGKRPIGSLEATDVLAVLDKAQAAGAVSTAYRLVPIFGRIFRYAKTRGLCEHIPSSDFRPKDELARPGRRSQPAVKQDELSNLVKAINTLEPRPRLALQLAMLLFTRANEMLKGEWTEIEGDVWRIPASRMKNRLPFLVPLAPQAQAILAELKELSCGSRWVFPGKTFEKPLTSKALLNAFERIGYAGIQTTHGLRRIASTALNEAADGDGRPLFSADAIERQLSHVKGADNNEIRHAYNEAEYLPMRRKMMAWWADRLDELAES